jgi:hypothetical protein
MFIRCSLELQAKFAYLNFLKHQKTRRLFKLSHRTQLLTDPALYEAVNMSLNIPNAPNAGLFKQGYQKYTFTVRLEKSVANIP